MVKTLNGLMVTSETGHDPRVYLIKNNKKHWIINEHIMASLGLKWEHLQRINSDKLDKLPSAYPLTSVKQQIYNTDDFIYCIEETWSDDYAIGVIGWAVGKKKPLHSLSVEIDGKKKRIKRWIEKSEVYDYFSHHSDFPVKKDCGFMAVVSRNKEHVFNFKANSSNKAIKLAYESSTDDKKIVSPDFPINKKLEKRFRDIVNENHLSVLEIGSRISPGGTNKRVFFKEAQSYTGIDYLPGPTVDIVGDAHELKRIFKRKKFDAIYSDSVLEHLAMPWKAVIEMNSVLKKGGYVFHSAPACWIPHDMPWDFWRFSDASMKVFFSKPFGFEVIDVEYTAPVSLHIGGKSNDDYARFPTSPAFGFITVLARKVKNIDSRKIRFNAALKDVVGEDIYPEWTD